MPNSERLNWVDMAKGISIILVVMMHSAYGVGRETDQTGYLHWIIGWATPFRMPEFFVISGLFLSQVIGRDWRRFADRRVVHYLYFYALWAVIQIIYVVAVDDANPASAISYIALAIVEPYGVLWFVYMLAVCSAVTKLLHNLKVPHAVVLVVAAVLQMAPIAVGSQIVDRFAEYFVYFYASYALAPLLFNVVDWTQRHVALSLLGLVAWVVAEAVIVFSPGFAVGPTGFTGGLSELPGVRLVLAFIGATALCVAAAMLIRLSFMDWLRWLGSNSIVVYVSFSIPLSAAITILLKLGFDFNTGLMSTVALMAAITAPLVLYWLIQVTSRGRFLFERPAWAHLPGAPGSRQQDEKPATNPAE